MDIKQFTDNAAGKIVEWRATGADGSEIVSPAFVPAPLPPDVLFDGEIQTVGERALLALGRLGAIVPILPNPKLISEPFLRREAVLSSRIEGTRTEIEGLVLYEATRADARIEEESPDVQDAREVANYVLALQHGLEQIKKLPICVRLLKDLHRMLLAYTGHERGRFKSPGEFRNSLAFIGSTGSIEDARYVAPPHEEVCRLMDDLEQYIHTPSNFATLVNIALIHYQFEAIHPFADGNGRLGRLLITLLLCSQQILPEPLLYLSAHFERNRTDYNNKMFAVSCSGAWRDWVLFFLQGVKHEAEDACERAQRVLALREEYRTLLQSETRATNILTLIDKLFEWPAISVKRAEELLGVTYQGAKYNIDKLVSLGIISEATGRERNRVFIAKKIIGLVS